MLITGPTQIAEASNKEPHSAPTKEPLGSFIIGIPLTGGNTPTPFAFMATVISGLSALVADKPIPEGFPILKEKNSLANWLPEKAGALLALVLPKIRSASKKKSAVPSAPPPPYPNIRYDFNGDGTADISRWQPSSAGYRVKNGTSYLDYPVGSSSAVAAPGDFDGGGITDAGTFNAGTWKYRTSPSASEETISWGQSGDVPVVGDYDGDGKSDAAVFRPSANEWRVRKSSTVKSCSPAPGCYTVITSYGSAGDIPIPGDFDADGTTDYAVFRPSTGFWHVQKSGGGSIAVQWGQSGDVPLQGDFDGDGKSDPAVFRPSLGAWYAAKSSSANYGSYISMAWGNWADQPVPADYS